MRVVVKSVKTSGERPAVVVLGGGNDSGKQKATRDKYMAMAISKIKHNTSQIGVKNNK